MSNPKILHIIIDGYSPSNEDNFFDNFDYLSDQYSVNSSFIKHNYDEYTVKSGDRPHSPDMWTRAYSRTSFSDVKQENDSSRLGVTTKISRIPSEKFLWNKLAKKGYNSWIYPFGQYYRLVWRNLLNESTKNRISGIAKYYGTDQTAIITDGDVQYVHANEIYYGMHETAWGREKVKNSAFKDYYENWKNLTPEFAKRMVAECYYYYSSSLIPMINSNIKLFEEEILPHLSTTLSSHELNYVHIGLVEADTLYHFTPLYDDIVNHLRKYYDMIIRKTVDMYDPDIIIITGDHGMSSPTLSPQHKRNIEVEWKGRKRRVKQSSWGVAPLYTDHSWDIGAVIYSKDSRYVNQLHNQVDNSDEKTYLMYDIYDYINNVLR